MMYSYIQKAITLHNNKYDYSRIIELPKRYTQVDIVCPIHGIFTQSFHKHLCGDGCKKCSIEEKAKERINTSKNKFIKKANIKHENNYDYSKVIWKGVDSNIIILCSKHGEFNIRPADHQNGRGCQQCSKKNKCQYNKLNTTEFIESSIGIWGDIYDYSKVEYTDSTSKITIICKKHGEFKQLPSNHKKYGCGGCGRELNKRNMCLKETCREEFVTKANVIHENKYDYSKTLYENAITKIIINCKLHGEFNISPNNHLNGKGCKICGIELSRISKVKSFDAYYREFIRIYGKKYDYSHVKWEGACNPISILCEKHGEFDVIPYLHKKGRECPKCSNRYSKISIDWLLFMEIVYSVEIVHATNIGEFLIPETRYKADGYLKSLNIIFEFHGDFWHGNPKVYDKSLINPRVGITYGELYQKTVMKSNIIKAKGYNLIEVWEYDWKKFTNGIICIQKKFKSRYK